jgi:hypothetical protein
VPRFLPLLQLKAFERGAHLWKGGLMLMSKSGDKDLVATIETLELYGDARVEDTRITRLLVCTQQQPDDRDTGGVPGIHYLHSSGVGTISA